MPALETEELARIYRAKGVPADAARALAERIMSDEDTAVDAMAREELGIDPEELGGSAAIAAVASFLPFTLGAAAGLPFVFLSGNAATVTSVAASAAGLFVLGSALTLLTTAASSVPARVSS